MAMYTPFLVLVSFFFLIESSNVGSRLFDSIVFFLCSRDGPKDVRVGHVRACSRRLFGACGGDHSS